MKEIFERVSTRDFTIQKVEDEKIELLLKAAMQAPSGRNSQPWEFIVVDDKELMLKTAEAAKPYVACRTSSHLIIVLCNNDSNLWTHDLGACCENILLEANHLGLGAVWQAIEPNPDRISAIKELYNIPDRIKPFAVIAVGYPKEQKTAQSRYDEKRIHHNTY